MMLSHNHTIRRSPALAVLAVAALSQASARAETTEPADSEITNYKSGISLVWEGTPGEDYMEEYFYHDRLVSDRKVVYLKSDTAIRMFHNERNIAGETNGSDYYRDAGPEVGRIMLKPDGDGRYRLAPDAWIPYTAPFTFADLDYGMFGDPGTPVVGSTGDNGLAPRLDNKDEYYHRGIRGPAGDEWHTITVADDDAPWIDGGDIEFGASDGKVFLFVIDPQTPCLRWRASGGGEFYTTPPKNYFVPRIFEQTTYFTADAAGDVRVEIRDIHGNEIFYRVNGGDFIAADGPAATLDAADFEPGENVLEYYYAGRGEHVATRRVVRNPDYPSSGEEHGDRLWLDAERWNEEMRDRLAASWWMNEWQSDPGRNGHEAIAAQRRTGQRTIHSTRDDGSALVNALVARCYGMDHESRHIDTPTNSFADFSKWALLEAHTALDPVGAEINTSMRPVATRELQYRGYYDVRPIFSYAAAYDILIGHYRSDQGHSNGITVIEDFHIRDLLARWVHNCGMLSGGFGSTDTIRSGGMWDTARKTGAAFIACMMPSYSTPYFGTSGVDGSRTTYPEPVFPTLNHTWFDLYLDNSVEVEGYPRLNTRMGVEEHLFDSEGVWQDRIGYSGTRLMGHNLSVYHNLLKLFHPEKRLVNFERAMERAARGELTGAKFNRERDRDPVFRSWLAMQNAWHPEFRAVAGPRTAALSNDQTEGVGKQYNDGGPLFVLWHDHDLPPGPSFGTGDPGTGGTEEPDDSVVVPAPVVEPKGGSYALPLLVRMETPLEGARIHYTLDGSEPTRDSPVYGDPLDLAGSTTLRAVAVHEEAGTGPEVRRDYQLGVLRTEGGDWRSLAITPVEEPFIIEFEAVAAVNSLIGAGKAAAAKWGDLAVVIRFAPDRMIDVRDGTSYRADAEIPYESGSRYRFEVEVDPRTGTYSVRAGAAGGPLSPIASDYAFREEQKDTTRFEFISSWTETETLLTEGIRVSGLESEPPSAPTGIKVEQQ